MKNEYYRYCPKCNFKIIYSCKNSLNRAIKENKHCKKCKDYLLFLNKKIPYDIELKIINLSNQGKSKKEIRDILKIGQKPVDRVFKENKLKVIKKRKPKYYIFDKKRKCKKCKKNKDIRFFRVHTIDSDGNFRRNSTCIHCINNQCKNIIYSSDEKYIRNKYISLRASSLRSKIKFDISFEDFYNQFLIQNKKCFYTDYDLVFSKKSKKENYWNYKKNSISVDKIIPEKGYIKGNIVFCSRRINIIKNDASLEEIKRWMPDWYNRINNFIEKAIK